MQFLKLEYFKNIILERISEFSGYSKYTKYLPEPVDHPVELMDQAAVETDRKLFVTLQKRQDNQIRELKDALKRIEDGTYGICMECEEEIPVQRLMARPMTRLCVECQETREKTYRQKNAAM